MQNRMNESNREIKAKPICLWARVDDFNDTYIYIYNRLKYLKIDFFYSSKSY